MSTTMRRPPAFRTRAVAGLNTSGQWVRETRGQLTRMGERDRSGTVATPYGLVAVQVWAPTERDDGAVYFSTMLDERLFTAWLDRWASTVAIARLAARWLAALHEAIADDDLA